MLVGDRAYRVLVTEFIFNECGFVTLVSQLKKKDEEQRLVLCMVTLGYDGAWTQENGTRPDMVCTTLISALRRRKQV